jgi:hypothetical protein
MKFIILLVLFNQYNFEFECINDTLQTGNGPFIFSFFLKNTGTLPDSYGFDCRIIDSVQGWFVTFCAGGQCVIPGVIIYEYLEPGQVDSEIHVTIYPDSLHFGREKINFCVWSLKEPNLRDSINVYGIREQKIYERNLEKFHPIFPLKVYDVSGRVIKVFDKENKKGIYIIKGVKKIIKIF